MDIVISFNEEWLEEYKKDSLIPAWIYFRHQGRCYPDDEWIDNPEVILGWWLHSITELIEGKAGQGLCFMEGPFFVSAEIKGGSFILKSEDKQIDWRVDKKELADSLIKAANKTSRKFHEHGLLEASRKLNEGVSDLRRALEQRLQNK